MASTNLIIELRRQQRKIEEALNDLLEQKKRIDERYASLMNEENKIYDEIHKCRDMYQYDRLQMRLSVISNQRKTIEQEKNEIEKKIRGYEEEIERIKRRIEYLTPRG